MGKAFGLYDSRHGERVLPLAGPEDSNSYPRTAQSDAICSRLHSSPNCRRSRHQPSSMVSVGDRQSHTVKIGRHTHRPDSPKTNLEKYWKQILLSNGAALRIALLETNNVITHPGPSELKPARLGRGVLETAMKHATDRRVRKLENELKTARGELLALSHKAQALTVHMNELNSSLERLWILIQALSQPEAAELLS
jgi:hypothetical protein